MNSITHSQSADVLPATSNSTSTSNQLQSQALQAKDKGRPGSVSVVPSLPSAPPNTAAVSELAPVILNAASLARMLQHVHPQPRPQPQMISSGQAGNRHPFVTYPMIQYATGINGACVPVPLPVHPMLVANPGWGYGLQGQLMAQAAQATPVAAYHHQMPAAAAPGPPLPMIHHPSHHHRQQHQQHHHSQHVQPHPNALLSSMAVAQAYQANMAAMAAMAASKHQQQRQAPSIPSSSQPGKYRDLAKNPYANDPDDDGDAHDLTNSGAKDQSFTVKLHRILSDPEFQDYICWMPHGRSWRVLKQDELEEKVIPLFYRHGKLASFMRQVNGWGFRRMPSGPDRNSYYHEMFLKGYPHLCAKMRRPLHKKKSTSEPKSHPNFQDSKSFVLLPDEKTGVVVSSSDNSSNHHDTNYSSDDNNGRGGGFDTDTTTNTGMTLNDGSTIDAALNMSNLYGSSSSGGSDRGSPMYGGSDQGSNLYASGCGSDQGSSNLYGGGSSDDQGSNSGENHTSSNGDQDSNQGTSNGDNSSDGSVNECDGEKTNTNMPFNMSSRISSSSETDDTSSRSRHSHHRSSSKSSSYRGDNSSKSTAAKARRSPKMTDSTAKMPRLSPANIGAQQQKESDCSETSSERSSSR